MRYSAAYGIDFPCTKRVPLDVEAFQFNQRSSSGLLQDVFKQRSRRRRHGYLQLRIPGRVQDLGKCLRLVDDLNGKLIAFRRLAAVLRMEKSGAREPS